MNTIDLAKITDLNLAFINPDTSGNFPANDAYRQVIEKAHSQNVRVFLSIGGGDPPAHLEGLLENDKRPTLIAALALVAEIYGFDGIDVDLENALINANYAPFVSELSAALKPNKKLMTAALASWNSNLISDAKLQLYDFINIMSYDKTGPWNLSKPGPHSPLSMAQDDFTYFNTDKKDIAAEKLFIGLPFYGYGFGNVSFAKFDVQRHHYNLSRIRKYRFSNSSWWRNGLLQWHSDHQTKSFFCNQQ